MGVQGDGDWQAAAPQAIPSAHSHEEAPAPQAEAAQGGPGARGPARDDAEAHACCPKEEVTRGSERTALRWSGVSARCQGQGARGRRAVQRASCLQSSESCQGKHAARARASKLLSLVAADQLLYALPRALLL